MSDDPSDLPALTSGYFLTKTFIGEASFIPSQGQRVKPLRQLFAIRWKTENLKEFHQRSK